MTPQSPAVLRDPVSDFDSDFATDVLDGLSRSQKTLPCRYFYDERGSVLFEEITDLPEYYPTRTEIRILTARAQEIIASFPPDAVLVEFGSGSSRKTEILLAAARNLSAYVPIDVSWSALHDAKTRLAERFPRLDVRPICADFSQDFGYPADLAGCLKIGFFPGSTIGNQTPAEAVRLLATMREALAPHGSLIVGVDLKKDTETLIRAYDDAAGVTAAFNLNLLTRINRELGASFDTGTFRHQAIYNPDEGRIEMHLVSRKDQSVRVLGRPIRFAQDESIFTESSYKYSVAQFQLLARTAGWKPQHVWLDDQALFSVHALAASD